MLGNRGFKQVWDVLFGWQHYRALLNMARRYPNFVGNLRRYLSGSGDYPYDIKVRTPRGTVTPRLFNHADLLSVNEIFCRIDYPAGSEVETVVDVGSNIGMSALYFLTRNKQCRCYCFEPDPKNIDKLNQNLQQYVARYFVHEKAVSNERGQLEFGVEETGRYGGIGLDLDETINVECLEINAVLRDVLSKEETIDILKLDTEGVEIQTVEAIDIENLSRIRCIYLEAEPNLPLHPGLFDQRQYGSVYQMVNRSHHGSGYQNLKAA